MRYIGTLSLFLGLAGLSIQQTTIVPSTVPKSDRDYWCDSQKSQCPLICLQLPGAKGDPKENSCDPKTLQYSCVCSNGKSPNATEYSQTIPFFICQEWGNRCVDACTDNTCADACRANHPCGATDPTRITTTAAIVSSTPAATTSALPKGALVDEDNPASRIRSPFALEDIIYGTPLVLTALLAGFGMML